jgi:hypothetical protein
MPLRQLGPPVRGGIGGVPVRRTSDGAKTCA